MLVYEFFVLFFTLLIIACVAARFLSFFRRRGDRTSEWKAGERRSTPGVSNKTGEKWGFCHSFAVFLSFASVWKRKGKGCYAATNRSLIFPYTLYGIPVWGQASQCDLKKILTLQKRALRLIFFVSKRYHAIPLFVASNILPVNMLYFETVSSIMHDVQFLPILQLKLVYKHSVILVF